MKRFLNGTQIDIPIAHIRVNDYDAIAAAFDRCMGDDYADIIAAPMLGAAKGLLRQSRIRHLDIGCGTGVLLLKLARRFGTDAHGVDLSAGQIRQAKIRAGKLGVQASFTVGDMRTTDFQEDFDLVTCNFDALNHVREPSAWIRIFRKVRRSLTDNGMFFFDLNTPNRIIRDWSNPEVILKHNICYLHCGLELRRGSGFVRRKLLMQVFDLSDRFYRRSTAIVEETAIPNRTVITMLRRAGFSHVRLVPIAPALRASHVFMRNRAFFCATP